MKTIKVHYFIFGDWYSIFLNNSKYGDSNENENIADLQWVKGFLDGLAVLADEVKFVSLVFDKELARQIDSKYKQEKEFLETTSAKTMIEKYKWIKLEVLQE